MKRDDGKYIERFIARIQRQATRGMCGTTQQRPSSSYPYRLQTSMLQLLRLHVLASVWNGAPTRVLTRRAGLEPSELSEFGHIEERRRGLRAPVNPIREHGLD